MRSMRPGFQTSQIYFGWANWSKVNPRFFSRDCGIRMTLPDGLYLCESRNGKVEPTANQKNRIKTPVIISASIQTKSMLNHARRSIATPSFS